MSIPKLIKIVRRIPFWVFILCILFLGMVSFPLISKMGDATQLNKNISSLEELQQFPEATLPIESAREAIGFVARSVSVLTGLREVEKQADYPGWVVAARLHEEDASRWWEVRITSVGRIPSFRGYAQSSCKKLHMGREEPTWQGSSRPLM